jgi:hypothetical protein
MLPTRTMEYLLVPHPVPRLENRLILSFHIFVVFVHSKDNLFNNNVSLRLSLSKGGNKIPEIGTDRK